VKTLRSDNGQFIPISAMAMFVMVVFLVALVNIYKVSKEKLKLQNLAEAVALNMAGQQAQAYNTIADRNEWLNHMLPGIDSPSDTTNAAIETCQAFSARNPTAIPGISCVENPFDPQQNLAMARSRHIFLSRDGAIQYALSVYAVNEAQRKFIEAY
jgi:hypothetical protein